MLKETLSDGLPGLSSSAAGCVLDSSGTLYTTNIIFNQIIVYSGNDPHVILRTFPTPGITLAEDQNNESLTLDTGGNLYVSHAAGGGDIHRYTPTGTLLQEYDTGIVLAGSDWIDLASDQRTVFYTSERREIKRYDVILDAPLPDFGTLPGNGVAYGLRILPPGDGSNGLLVADRANIKRLDGNGMVVQTYDLPNDQAWFALSLDPDGKSFWAGDTDVAKYYRFDIASGAVLGSFDTNSRYLGGICVFGEIRAAEPCGNGRLDLGEECDDGNRLPGDGCDTSCHWSPCITLTALPEVNPYSLRITRVGTALEDIAVNFDASDIPTQADHINVYRGTIATFRNPPHYNHTSIPGGCGLLTSPFVDGGAAAHGTPDVYYLAVAGCPKAMGEAEGSYGDGWDSGMTPRPSARDLGTDPCP